MAWISLILLALVLWAACGGVIDGGPASCCGLWSTKSCVTGRCERAGGNGLFKLRR